MAGDTGAKHFRAVVAGIGGERVSRRFQKKRIDAISRHCIPASDDVVGAAGEQGAAVGQKRHRPTGKPGTDQRARQIARFAIDHRHRSADARGGQQRAVGRDRDRDHRFWSGCDLACGRAGCAQK
jgi:hypothetical protein